MDWLAVQRLKVCVLLEERGTRLKLTQAGKDTLRRLRLARPKRAPAEMLTVDAWAAVHGKNRSTPDPRRDGSTCTPQHHQTQASQQRNRHDRDQRHCPRT